MHLAGNLSAAQSGHFRSAVEVGDAAHRVVRRRRDQDRLLAGVVAGFLDPRHQAGEARPLDGTQWSRSGAARVDRSRDHIAWRELVCEALAMVVEEERSRPSAEPRSGATPSPKARWDETA